MNPSINITLQLRLRRFYFSALMITALVTTVSYLALSQSTAQQLELSHHVSQTTDQHRRIQAVAFLTSRLVTVSGDAEREAVRNELHQTIDETALVEDAWLNGQYSPEVREILFDEPHSVERNMSLFLDAAQELASAEHLSPGADAYQQIAQLRPLLLDGITAVAERFRLEGDTNIIATYRLEGILLVVLLATLGLQLVLIFRPMEQLIRQEELRLREQLADNQAMMAALSASEERLRFISDNIRDVTVQTDAEGKCTFVSPSVQAVLGYDPTFLIGTFNLPFIHPDDQEKTYRQWQTDIENREGHRIFEYRVRHADGHYRWHEAAANYLYDTQGNFAGTVTVARDITERKRLQELSTEQEKLQAALHKEHELSELKTRMMLHLNHEFRTPLAIIHLATESIEHYWERFSPEQRAAKSAIIRAKIQQLTNMLNAIETVVNNVIASDSLTLVSVDLSALCREVALNLETKLNLPGKFALDLPQSAVISADTRLLSSAVSNILVNAAVYSSAPTAVVNVRLSLRATDIELRVEDSGIGIPAHELERISEPFFRGSNVDAVGGLGLGLTIARATIEAHRGSIHVESVQHQGTTVTVRLPSRP